VTTATTAIAIDPLLRLSQVLQVFPVSRSVWYAGVQAGTYPRPVKIGARAAAWRSSDIANLIKSCGEGSLEHAV
jgi:prophage regulatory protein